MTKIVAQHNDLWTLKKIQSLVDLEATMLKRKLDNVQNKIAAFENRYGQLDRESLYGKVDDMELIEWEGEIETLDRLQEKLTRLKQIAFEYE
jgi:hypothetical protein